MKAMQASCQSAAALEPCNNFSGISMSLLTLKLISSGLIFGVGLIGGIFARRLANAPQAGTWLALGNCFAGGVFLGAGLIHLLPDAASDFATTLPKIDYPLASLCAALAVAGMLALDQVTAHAGQGVLGAQDASDRGTALREGRAHGGWVLFLMLSVHSIITGVSLGLEPDGLAAATLLLAILAHKGTAAFALSVQLIGGGAQSLMRPLILFSLMTPVGILLGSALNELLSGTAGALFEAVFDALAAGTFLFVAVFEILGREFSPDDDAPAAMPNNETADVIGWAGAVGGHEPGPSAAGMQAGERAERQSEGETEERAVREAEGGTSERAGLRHVGAMTLGLGVMALVAIWT